MPLTVTVDESGRLLGTAGIGDCAHHPRLCRFAIGEREAIRIAHSKGFPEGLRPWRVTFSWTGGAGGRYVWSIESTLRDDGAYHQAGRFIQVDANTGAATEQGEWSIMD